MHRDAWSLFARFQIKYNHTAEGPRPRPVLVIRFGSARSAWKAVTLAGVGRIKRGSALFEGKDILPALRWLGCKDRAILSAAEEVQSALEITSPTRILTHHVENLRDLIAAKIDA